MKKRDYKDSKNNNNNSITYNFIILIFSIISLFVESIITIISLFKKGIVKKENSHMVEISAPQFWPWPGWIWAIW